MMYKVNSKLLFGVGMAWLTLLPIASKGQEISKDLSHRFEELMYGKHARTQQLKVRGHSHNDYAQDMPFWRAYHAGMESIEVDLYLDKNTLYAAHERSELQKGKTLEQLYLQPLAQLFAQHGHRPFADKGKSLQLVLDLKEDHRKLMPELLKLLEKYRFMLDTAQHKQAIQVVISGDMPRPSDFVNYPSYISFDGRPQLSYSPKQLERVAMFSESLRSYTEWNGKGVPERDEMARIMTDSENAKRLGKPFRLWAVPESANTWIILEKMGVTWLNTDQPEVLKTYLESLDAYRYENPTPHQVYQPSYATDGSQDTIHNVILLIGDGMGLAHVQAGMVANSGQLNVTRMRHLGFSITTSLSPGNTDSAAGGSAIATGHKTYNGMLSVDSLGHVLPKIPDRLAPLGIVTGVLSSGDASDATPAAFYASNINRNASQAISESLLTNNAVSVVAGGIPSPYKHEAKRKDFEKKLQGKGYDVSYDINSFAQSKQLKNVLYLSDSTLRPIKEGRKDVLRKMLSLTLDKLKDQGKGFFVMCEGAQIDYGGHARDLEYVATEMLDFDLAIGEAMRFADQDKHTLVIVTADHETGALSLLDADAKHGYVQGHFASNDHGSMMVPVMAYGPGAQNFIGYYQNTALYKKILLLFGVKD